jgi:hypothetical protein
MYSRMGTHGSSRNRLHAINAWMQHSGYVSLAHLPKERRRPYRSLGGACEGDTASARNGVGDQAALLGPTPATPSTTKEVWCY